MNPAAILGAAVVLTVGLWLIFGRETRDARGLTRRMRGLAVPGDAGRIDALIRERRGASGLTLPFYGDPALLVDRGGLAMGPRTFLALSLGGFAVLGAVLSVVAGPAAGVPVAFAVAVLAPVTVLKRRHTKRVAAFTAQLPDALDLMMRGLRVGHPVGVTVASVGRTMADPIGAEFRTMADQIAHGDYLTDAFDDLARRIGQEDAEYLSVAIGIQHGTGGNLAEMLGTLARVIRDRITMRRRIRAISSEGRISAMLLSALPVAIYVATSVSSPGYYADVAHDPLFAPMAVVIVVLVVANALALRRLVTFSF